MISIEDFYRAYATFRPPPNEEQRRALELGPEAPLFIVAGPGTGKTACLTLRILKLILVDGILPRGILATTFTNKAAAELRSRVLSWGFSLTERLLEDDQIPGEDRERLCKLDVNQVVTGTIDSICERLLREFRDPGTQPPILADDYVSKTLLLREGLFAGRRYQDPDLDSFLANLHGPSRWGFNVGRKNDLIQSIWERRYHDQLDWNRFVGNGSVDTERALQTLNEVLDAYRGALDERGMVDFALLEQEVLSRLRNGQLREFFDDVEVVLVDEYQDTNLMQESIYFEMAKICNGALTVVGDDDQSLYRFRGATVELYSEFASRYRNTFGSEPDTVFLKTNYRSTRNVIGFVNDYAGLDAAYGDVRVAAKPPLGHGPTADRGVPILAMFRDDAQTLASDLADFVEDVFRGSGYTLPDGTTIECGPDGGDVGDCALLCRTPREYNSSHRERLPLFLREELKERDIEIFNPRGQDLTDLELIRRFGGLLLECLDPGGEVEDQITSLDQGTRATFRIWRNEAIDFAESSSAPPGLRDFAVGWADRDPQRKGQQWPRTVPVLSLVYALTHYLPDLHDDPEGQVYLEVFTRQISACEQVGKFSGRVLHDPSNKGLSDASIKELLRDFLGPIAAGTVKVNEDLMETFPRDRLGVLSIHQAKGLEFPLTIVDVGSDYTGNYAAQAFGRFPNDGGTPHVMENLLRPHTALKAPSRSAQDRAFDDLYRQFFVAYSRPQEVLLLAGLRKTFPGGPVRNVATGWSRDGTCQWSGDDLPFVEI